MPQDTNKDDNNAIPLYVESIGGDVDDDNDVHTTITLQSNLQPEGGIDEINRVGVFGSNLNTGTDISRTDNMDSERKALSMAIRHHQKMLKGSNIEVSEIWEEPDKEDTRDDTKQGGKNKSKRFSGLAAVSEFYESMGDLKANEDFPRGMSSRILSWSIRDERPFVLSRLSRVKRIFLFILALIASSLIAVYLGNGIFGKHAATFMNEKKTSTAGKKQDEIMVLMARKHKDLEEMNILLPSELDLVLGDRTYLPKITDTPMFWQIPKAGGNSIKLIMSQCLGMVEASELGKVFSDDPGLRVISLPSGEKYINVDTNSPNGIKRAIELRLVESGMADFVVTSYLYEAAEMFSPFHQGKAFTILRNPIDRAMSIYRSHPSSKFMSAEDFFSRGQRLENNWMTRSLSNKFFGPLTSYDLNLAMDILRRKFVVGIVDEIHDSISVFASYYGWPVGASDDIQQCISKLTKPVGSSMTQNNPTSLNSISKDSPLWELIEMDMLLYEYGQFLFQKEKKHL